jgi:CheY-like chemotaxis protein
VLIIENTPTQIRLYEIVGQQIGIKTKFVSSCQEGLRALESLSYDLVILDWDTQDMSGSEALRLMRRKLLQLGRKTPLICISAHAMKGEKEKVLASGFDDYLSKPCTIDQFKGMIHRWLPRRTRSMLRADYPSERSS